MFLMSLWKLLMPIGALVMFFAGLQGLYEGLGNPYPTTMSCLPFVLGPPSSGWYHVAGALVDLNQSAALTDDGRRPGYGEHAEFCYIALHDPEEPRGTPVRVFVRTTDPSLIQAALVSAANANGAYDGGQRAPARTPVYRSLDVTGMMQPDLSHDTNIQRRLGNVAHSVDSNFAIIADKTAPNISKALLKLIAGLLLGYGCALAWFGEDNPFRRHATQADLPAQPGLGSISYSPPPQYPSGAGGYPPAYGQAPPPSQYAQPQIPAAIPPLYTQAPPSIPPEYGQAPRREEPAPEPAKTGKNDSIPPVFDPFTEQR